MNTIELQDNISYEQYQMAIDVLNAIGVKVKTSEKEQLPNFVVEGIKKGIQEIHDGKGISSEELHKQALELCMK